MRARFDVDCGVRLTGGSNNKPEHHEATGSGGKCAVGRVPVAAVAGYRVSSGARPDAGLPGNRQGLIMAEVVGHVVSLMACAGTPAWRISKRCSFPSCVIQHRFSDAGRELVAGKFTRLRPSGISAFPTHADLGWLCRCLKDDIHDTMGWNLRFRNPSQLQFSDDEAGLLFATEPDKSPTTHREEKIDTRRARKMHTIQACTRASREQLLVLVADKLKDTWLFSLCNCLLETTFGK